nr:glycosyltransferase family 4 protein [uncultured Flavobacterium sp.]
MGVLYKIKRKIWKFFFEKKNILFYPYKGISKVDLLIYDDVFPHPISGFRLEEFSVLLKRFKKSKILMTPDSYPALKTPKTEHQNHINELIVLFPFFKKKMKFRKSYININAKLFYCVFIQNIFPNLWWLEKYKIPFAFTLYPGGGFQIDDLASDMKLKEVFSSPQFRKVIVTQLYTKEYLINNNFCPNDKIEYVFGCVVPQNSKVNSNKEKNLFLKGKDTLDICFCAAKYMDKGLDKGYDLFIEAAISIANKYDFVRFHVIGGFDKTEIDVTVLKDKITFYGYQNFENLAVIFKNTDIIVSPNRPFCLGKGFDGFPLGTVIEAAFNGAVALVTDKLNQNSFFVNNEEIVIIESTSESIVKEIEKLIDNPEKLYSLSRKGREKFIEIYSNDFQMKPRIELLDKIINTK